MDHSRLAPDTKRKLNDWIKLVESCKNSASQHMIKAPVSVAIMQN
jgi:hypothetical protein